MSDILFPIIGATLTGIISYVSIFIKKFIEEKIKENVIKHVVNYVEQVYSDLSSEEKFEKAVEASIDVLEEKKISISETEIKMLIESTCLECQKQKMNV